MSTVIAAAPERVWRALTTPDELIAWDERMLAPVETPHRYPQSGQSVCWRYRLGGVQVVMHECPTEVSSPERLRRTLLVGSLRYEQTFDVIPESSDPPRTRLALKTVAANSVPVVGHVVDRFAVRRITTEHVDETLRALRRWCEASG